MYQTVNFSHKSTHAKPTRYYFEIVMPDQENLYFYTFDDLSGFCLEYVYDAKQLMTIAAACCLEQKSMADQIKENRLK